MTAHDDETETSSQVTSDPALDATDRATNVGSPEIPVGVETDEQPRVAFIGRYRVIDALGSGGMGVVYRARDRELDRDLAIKVVRSHGGTTRAQERLLAEARSMAKLRHPAVVPIFDVGVAARGVFIVMPMVGGGTLYDWMKQRHSWREVVAMFITAGHGLAAAHAAGLVHRDFKPRNVLIGDRGEPMVADFGIATRTDESIDPESTTSTPGQAQVSSIAGTPAYMAPEQAESNTIDARADQYSFCISFWEALCGERPHEAVTRTQGSLPAPVARSVSGRANAPAWLLAILARGFSALPDHRWPSMNALIERIERRMRRPRHIAAAVSILAVLATSATVIAMARAPDENPCPDPGRRLAGIWTPEVRTRVQAAFAATGAPYAAASFDRVVSGLDRYVTSWRLERIQACRANAIERTQSTELHDRRVHCLDRHLDVVRARTAILLEIDLETLPRAEELVETLPPLADCSDTTSLLDAFPLPADPKVRLVIADLEKRIRDVDALAVRGSPTVVLERSDALAKEARTLGHPPTLVMALRSLSEAQRANGVSAETTQREVAEAAALARDDAALAAAWSRLVIDLARARRFDEARALEPVAEAALTRAGGAKDLVFRVNSDLGGRAYEEDDQARATERYRTALAAASTSLERRSALTDLASALRANMRGDEALPLIEEAVKVAEEAHGPQHPIVASSLLSLGIALQATGSPDDLVRATEVIDRSLAIRTAAFGTTSSQVAETLSSAGVVFVQRGKFADAVLALRRAVSIMEPRGETLLLGKIYRRLGDAITFVESFDAARPHYERALAILESTSGRTSMEYVNASLNYAVELADRGECTSALPHAANARDVLEPQGHPGAAFAFTILGKCELAAGRNAAGFAWLEKAVEVCTTRKCFTGNLEDMQYDLGKRLVETNTDRAHGLTLLRKSQDGFKALGREDAVAEIEQLIKRLSKR